LTIRYWPLPSVVAVRTFSMSAGLVASTVTPGNTAPEASLTTPAIAPSAWAPLGTGATKNATIANATTENLFIAMLLGLLDESGSREYTP
jgi:hypothetical protein